MLNQNAVARHRVCLLLFAALLCLWNPAAGFAQSIESVAASRDGKTLVTGGQRTIRFWDLQTKKLRSTLMTGYAHVESVALSNDGRLLAVNTKLILRLPIDKKQLQQLPSISRYAKWALSMAFSPDGRSLAVGDAQGDALLLIDTRTRVERRLAKNPWYIISVTFSPDGETLLSGGATQFGNTAESWAGTITLWDVQTGQTLRQIESGESVKSVAFSPDGQLFASGGYN